MVTKHRSGAIAATAVLALITLLAAGAETATATATATATVHQSSATAASPSRPRIVATTRIGDRVVELTIATPDFATPTHVDVDLPTGYRRHPERRWPVAYFLAGIMNTYASFNSVVHGVQLIRHFPAIVVSPNGDSGWWSDWYNDGRLGAPKYESFVIDELIPLIDATFRTVPNRAHRAVAGVSMGGDGAMLLAAEHPDLFADAASLSGAVNPDSPDIAAVLSLSPELQGANLDAIYGSPATQEVRWRGHDPTVLAGNLRGLDLQVRTANGIPNPAIGEQLLSADTVSCVIEGGVYGASITFNNKLNALHIPHVWHDYGPGCHTPQNFEREIKATLPVFARDFRHPRPRPSAFDYESIQPRFEIYGWQVRADRDRALEFLRLSNVDSRGLTLAGSGTTTVTTPRLFRGVERVHLSGATTTYATPDDAGRITFRVNLGPPDRQQEYTLGATTKPTSRTVGLRA